MTLQAVRVGDDARERSDLARIMTKMSPDSEPFHPGLQKQEQKADFVSNGSDVEVKQNQSSGTATTRTHPPRNKRIN